MASRSAACDEIASKEEKATNSKRAEAQRSMRDGVQKLSLRVLRSISEGKGVAENDEIRAYKSNDCEVIAASDGYGLQRLYVVIAEHIGSKSAVFRNVRFRFADEMVKDCISVDSALAMSF